MYSILKDFITKPEAFHILTRSTLWTKAHLAKNMLETHLDQSTVAASRPKDFIDKSVAFIDSSIDLKNKRVIDFGCGPGLYTERYTNYGALVTGIDFSANSINYAQKVAQDNRLDIQYLVQDYLTYDVKNTFDFASLIYCDYCAISQSKREILLQVIHNCLKENGILFMDVHTVNMFDHFKEDESFKHHEKGGFFSPESYFEFTKNYAYQDEKISLTHYLIVEENETWEIYNWLQHYTVDHLKRELSEAGFEVIGVYENVAGEKYTGEGYDLAVMCRKVSK